MSEKKKEPMPRKRMLMIVLCAFLAVVLVALIVVTAYIESIFSMINRFDPDATLDTMSESEYNEMLKQEEQDPNFTGPEIDPDDVVWGSDVQLHQGENIINILLIGQDRREGETRARSDAMILCTINKEKKTLTMTSFMRDMYVQIPGYKDNRINASYAFGGMKLLNKCLNKNFGLEIDGNVEVDFTGFQTVIDTLGGLDIELTAAEAEYLNRRGNWDIEDNAGEWSLKEGVNRLNGSQAVAFSRIRYVGNGDFGRTNRQRVLLSKLLERMKQMSAFEVKDLLDEILPLLTTDLSNAEIMGYAMELFPLLTSLEISTQQIPAEGAYSMASIDGMSVLLPDLKKNVAILEKIMED